MEFEKIVMERYAVKSFDGKKIPESKLIKLLEIIRYSPSSFNLQPWAIRIVEDMEMKKKLKAASWNQAQVDSCSHLLVFCANKDIKGCIDKLESIMIESIQKSEGVKAYAEMMRNFEKGLTEDQKIAWAHRQVYIALGNALNGAKYLGFDSCPMEGFDPAAYSKILNLPQNLVPSVLCPIGYAADKPMPKLRFGKEDIFIMD